MLTLGRNPPQAPVLRVCPKAMHAFQKDICLLFLNHRHEEKAQGLLDNVLKQTIYLLVGGVPVWSSK